MLVQRTIASTKEREQDKARQLYIPNFGAESACTCQRIYDLSPSPCIYKRGRSDLASRFIPTLSKIAPRKLSDKVQAQSLTISA
jgi:hypothetical protein